MEKEKANIVLPDGTIINRTVKSVLKQIAATCMGYHQRTIQYKNDRYYVEEYNGNLDAKYKLGKKVEK